MMLTGSGYTARSTESGPLSIGMLQLWLRKLRLNISAFRIGSGRKLTAYRKKWNNRQPMDVTRSEYTHDVSICTLAEVVSEAADIPILQAFSITIMNASGNNSTWWMFWEYAIFWTFG